MTAIAFASVWLIDRSACMEPSAKLHHTSTGFRNVYGPDPWGWLGFLAWRWQRLWKTVPSSKACEFHQIHDALGLLHSYSQRNTVTWVGHATVLLRVEGKNILTDPHFSDRASPFQFVGPKRVMSPGLSLDQLPMIHAVVISHDHYDSLDTGTIRRLHERSGGRQTVFFVPLRLKRWFSGLGIDNVVEMDWWEEQSRFGLQFMCVPVQHWSGRVPFTRNKSLWAGWAIRTANFRFFFAGDSGYTPHFKEIGERLGPFDFAAIPIGAYEPRWFMRPHHMNPEEALAAHVDVKSKKSVGIHWGTFVLSDEALDEPPRKIAEAKQAMGLKDDEFVVLLHGETIAIEDVR
jgi:N-acyl-phosphatidylethanolamine-hydrolysing phospholipase D